VQSNELFAVLAIGLSVTSITGLAVLGVMLRGYRRNQRVIMGSRGTVDVAEHMAIVDDKLTNLRLAVEDLTLTARDHGVRIDGTLSHVGIVRFDAYQDLGGRQSTAVAFLNSRSDGVVITTVVSRDFARMYVKLVKDGVGDIPLAPEEQEAVQQAKRATPFVLRPLAEGAAGESAPEIDLAAFAEGEPMVVSMPGPYEGSGQDAVELERENRRRKRKGLAPIRPADQAPSAQGWDIPATPPPPGVSMAEQFLQQRRKGKRGQVQTADEDTGSFAPADDDGWATPQDEDRWDRGKADDDGWGFSLSDDDDTRGL
jgi:hypothetical protein